jgi:amino acid adenylation domain-containing protein
MSSPATPFVFPASDAQRGLWFLDRMYPGLPVYNVNVLCWIDGDLQPRLLERTLNEIVRRHESLRTGFEERDGEPVQVVAPALTLPLPLTDTGHLAESEREPAVCRMAVEEAARPFDLATPPLVRAHLFRLAPERHALALVMHHAICDGLSMPVLLQEIRVIAAALARGQDCPLPDLGIQYVDYTAWQQKRLEAAGLGEQLAYWRERLAGLQPVELPADRPVPAEPTFRGGRHPFRWDAGLVERLHGLARAEGASLYMVLLAAFQALLHRYSGQTDLGVGCPVAGRPRQELAGLIGLFVNRVVLRTDLAGDPPFRELLSRVRRTVLGAFEHQDAPFDRVVDQLRVERSPGRSPLQQVVLNLLTFSREPEPEGARFRLRAEEYGNGTAKQDLSVEMMEVDGELDGAIEYSADLFDAATVARLAGHLRRLTESALQDPGRRLSQLAILGADERHRLLVEPHPSPARGEERAECVHRRFAAQARRTPDAPAAVCEGETLTFAELDRRANRLAHHLRAMGVGPERVTGLCLEPSLDMVVGLLGILKAGGAYVPLDPGQPPERLRFVLGDAGAGVVVTREGLTARLPEEVVAVRLDRDAAAIEKGPDTETDTGVTPANLAYVIHTSGSTGRPKGVGVEHRQLDRYLAGVCERVGLGAGVYALVQPLTFDSSANTVYPPLVTGGCLLLVPPDAARDAAALADRFTALPPDVLKIAPSHLAALLADADARTLLPARTLIIGGEPSSLRWARRLPDLRPGCEVHSHYGPTETTVGVTCLRLADRPDLDRPSTPIGRPLPHARGYVLDADLELLPEGVPGELWVGGAQVARGYVGRPDLTAERFRPDPLAGPGARMYRTGDRCRWLPGGVLEFEGRVDRQVKVRGFRIEPGEIEAALRRHPGVREAAVEARDEGGRRRLVAYVVATGAAPLASELRAHLAARLPEHMVPAAFVLMDGLPLTRHGKLDRAALPEAAPEDSARVAPRDATERALAEVWRDVLGLEELGVADNYFDLGGDSITSIRIVARARAAGLVLTPQLLFRHQTIAELAGAVAPPIPPPGEGAEVPPAPAQLALLPAGGETPASGRIEARLPLRRRLEPAALERALGGLAARHDALRLRLDRDGSRWRLRAGPRDGTVPLSVRPLDAQHGSGGPRSRPGGPPPDWRDGELARLAARLDPAAGVWLAATLVEGEAGQELLLAGQHLAVDARSLRMLLEELEAACRPFAAEPPAAAPSFAGLAVSLPGRGADAAAAAELERRIEAGTRRCWRLPIRRGWPEAPALTEVVLDEEETRRLAAAGGDLKAPALAAVGAALARRAGGPVLVDVDCGTPPEFGTLPVGPLGCTAPVLLGAGGTPDERLAAAREELRRARSDGWTVELARRWSRDREARERLDQLAPAVVGFHHVEPAACLPPATELFDAGLAEVRDLPAGHGLEVVVTSGARLRIALRHVLSSGAADDVAADLLAELRAMAGSLDGTAGDRAPAGVLPHARLSPPELARLLSAPPLDGRADRLEDACPLSPIQEAMLLETLRAPGSGVYVQQFAYRVEGDLDPAAFRRAWQQVVDRHPLLRSAFVWEGAREPMQVALRGASLPWREEDLRGLTEAEQEERLDALLAAERRRGLALDRPPLARLALLRTGERSWLLVSSMHHLLIDGWSRELITREALALYGAQREGREAHLPPARPYADAVTWWRGADTAAAEAYWRLELAGFTRPTPLPGAAPSALPEQAGPTGDLTQRRVLRELDPALAARLDELGRRLRVTLSTVVHGAWALALGRWSGEADVLFGSVISGRPPRLPGVETMVGPFVSTVPVRVRLPGGARLEPWLHELQDRLLEQQEQPQLPLASFPTWNERGQRLFESVLDFQAFWAQLPGPGGAGDVSLHVVRGEERTDFPLVVAVSSAERLWLRLDADTRRLDEDALHRIADGFARLLDAMASAGPEATLDEVAAALPAAAAPPAAAPPPAVPPSPAWSAATSQQAGPGRTRPSSGPLRRLAALPFERRTAFLERLRAAAGARPDVRPVRRPRAAVVPASLQQERLAAAGGAAAFLLRLDGELDPATVREATRAVVLRHEALRGRLVDSEGRLVVELAGEAAVDVEVADLAGLAPAEREPEAARRIEAALAAPFDLAHDAAARCLLLRLEPGRQLLVWMTHAAAADADSLRLVAEELGELCEQGPPGRPDASLDHGDYAVWQRERLRGPLADELAETWRHALAGAEPAELAWDGTRRAGAARRLTRHRMGPAAAAGLEALASEAGAEAAALAAAEALLLRHTAREDLVLGMVAGLRPAGLERAVGPFADLLPVRADLSGDPSIAELATRARAQLAEAHARGVMPLALLTGSGGPAGQPLLRVAVNVPPADPPRLRFGGLETAFETLAAGGSGADMTLTLLRRRDGIEFTAEHDVELVEPASAGRLLGHMDRLLAAAATAPDVPVSRLPLVGEEERRLVLAWGRGAAAPVPDRSIVQVFEVQAARRPGADAVVTGDASLTYAELDRRASRLAHQLRRLGVVPEAPVGVCLRRSPDMVVAVLGVLRAGGAYLPLDPTHPPARLALMARDAGAAVAVTEESLRGLLAAAGCRLVSLDGDRDALLAEPAEAPLPAALPQHLAYVLYTSGSTGAPKGVLVEQRSVVGFVEHIAGAYGIDERSRVLAMAPLGFDVSVFEIFGALLRGAALHLADDEDRLSAERLQRLLRERAVTVAELPPALMPLLEPADLPDLAVVSVGGEAPPGPLVERWATGRRRFVNGYGPTEATVAVTLMECRGRFAAPPPIGRPMANHGAFVLDGRLEPTGIGVPGELCLAGAGLARGYLGRPGETADRFRPDPFGAPGERLYRTGDRARWLPHGNLEYLDRLDRQVKVRGHRVELGELETALRRLPSVEEAAVEVRTDEQGTVHLVAYVCGAEPPGLAGLREHLGRLLPAYMLPTRAVRLDRLPLTPAGKIDRRALPDPGPGDAGLAGSREPRTAAERRIAAEIFGPLLGTAPPGADEHFFELGGNSLQATQVTSRVRDVFGVEVSLTAFFERPTVAHLASLVEAARRMAPAAVALADALREEVDAMAGPPVGGEVAPDPPDRAPLSYQQEAVWRVGPGRIVRPAFNAPLALRVRGPLDVGALRAALERMAARHAALRTVFDTTGAGREQVVLPEARVPFDVKELSGLRPAEREAEARRLVGEQYRRPFDLDGGPLIRVQVLRLRPEEHVLSWAVHHLVTDAWSIGIQLRELAALYREAAGGPAASLPEPPLQYGDFARWQRTTFAGESLEQGLARWVERLRGVAPTLELPFRRPTDAPFRHGARNLVLDRRRSALVREHSRRAGVTPFMTLLAAYAALLGRLTGAERLMVVCPVAGRNRSELEGVMGFFVNRLPLAIDVGGDPTFAELVERVRLAAAEGFADQEVPFQVLLDRLPGAMGNAAPAGQLMFSIQNTPVAAELLVGTTGMEPIPDDSGLIFTPVLEFYSPAGAPYQLSLMLRERADGTLQGGVEFDAARLDPAGVERLVEGLGDVLDSAAGEPDQRLSRLAAAGVR